MMPIFIAGDDMKTVALAVLFFGLVGCATPTTGVVPLGEGMHTISRQGNGFWVSTSSLKSAAILEANEFCKQEGKRVKIINSKEIQAGGGRWPECEILFKCE